MQNFSSEAMTAVIVEFLQRNAQLQAGVAVTHGKRSLMTWRGKGHKGQGAFGKRVVGAEHTHQVFHVRTHCFGHMAKDCWFKEWSKGGSWNREPSTCKRDEKGIYSVFSGTISQSNLEGHSEKR